MTLAPDLLWWLGGTLTAYVVALYVLCLGIQGRIQTTEDFLIAGRRLGLPLATATILATWFGAGTVLTAADEVRRSGLSAAALEPVGAGVCLLLAGWFVARPLWRMKLLTLGDLFRVRFGQNAEVLSAVIMVPSYFGWVAAQFVALAGMLHLFFGIELALGIFIVAAVGTGYTWVGGMWSVTLTDALQMGLVLVGLVLLGGSTLMALGDGDIVLGLARLWSGTPPELRTFVPSASLESFVEWIGLFAVAALGNLPSQDLVQRVFASRSAGVARRACLASGYLYLGFGFIPVILGLAGNLLFPESLEHAVLPALAHGFTHPVVAVTFTVVLTSAVLSSIDSGILAPAAVLSENVFGYLVGGRVGSLALNRMAVLLVGFGSLAMAYAGETAYSLLEESYEVVLVSLFVPMAFAIYGRRPSSRGAIASMLVGVTIWLVHFLAGWDSFAGPWTPAWSIELPVSLTATFLSLVGYLSFTGFRGPLRG